MKAGHLLRSTLVASAAALSGAAAAGLGQPDHLRIGVAHIAPEMKSTEFRVFTDEGFEQEIGRKIAASLGLEVRFVRIAPGDGRDLLETGVIDMVVERVASEELALSRQSALDTGFASAMTVAMRGDTDIRNWSDLAGRTVCVSEANREARRVAAGHRARLRIERAPALSLMLVRTGECDAALHDEATLSALFEQEGWQKFSATLEPIEPSSLVVETAAANETLRGDVAAALASLSTSEQWEARLSRWARNVSFEVYLEQDAPDCH